MSELSFHEWHLRSKDPTKSGFYITFAGLQHMKVIYCKMPKGLAPLHLSSHKVEEGH